MSDIYTLPEVHVVAEPIIRITTTPFIDRQQMLPTNISSNRPVLPNIDANRGQMTSLVAMAESVIELSKQADLLSIDIDFILNELDLNQKNKFQSDINQLTAYREQVFNAKANADRKFNEQLTSLKLWNFYNSPKATTELAKLDLINVVLLTLPSPTWRRNWENSYGIARRQEIEARQRLVDFYRKILTPLNEAYLTKFYTGYSLFPATSKAGAMQVVQQIGAKNLHDGFLSDRVEILISDSMLTHMGSQFGHVGINIGGVVYGRAPAAWDVRSVETYIEKQREMRGTVGYVLQLNTADKVKLLQAITTKIVKDVKYSIFDHSCSGEVVSAFSEININIVDPRWTFGAFSPADIDNFLGHAKMVIQKNIYPKK